ncbi:putative MFS family arabinose efflux permease [Melghirimyces profundicolus]|uniref:Putative MFS family arabinose efflux permease n=1 Tax=Melghirimyces profundicolus TaxID=1242148 RepID=A0A2T6C872_9BACL|nr:MFS transporter [Melghirimyces profundicolus]PTX64509.1 putative MFS family arabinose efflux permease [Melghirimyces profundicolus]
MRWKDWDRNLKIRLLGEGMVHILFWMFFPFMAVYFADSFGKGAAGGLLILSQVIGVFANLVGGYCADRFGRKRMMVASAFGQGVAFVFFALANSPWYDSPVLSFVCFTALGVFGSLYWPASHAMVADLVKPEYRNQVFAVFYTAINIAVVIGPVLGGLFFFEHRFTLLLTAAAVTLILTFVIARCIRETVPRPDDASGFRESKDLPWYRFLAVQLRDYRVILSDRNFVLFILAGILAAQTFMQLDLAIAVYVTEMIPVQSFIAWGDGSVTTGGAEFFGWLMAENGFLVVLFTVRVTRWVDRWREGPVFVVSSLLYGVSMLVIGSSTHLWVAVGGIALLTVAELLVVGLQEGFVSKLAPEDLRGQYFAAASLRFSIGRAIAPFAIPMAAWAGYAWTFVVLAAFAFVSASVYHVLFRRLERSGRLRVVPSRRKDALEEGI